MENDINMENLDREKQKDIIESLHYRKREEGFDYCFIGYSSWEELKDEKFHKLRLKYIEAQKELDNYIEELFDSIEE
jgi:hypothetical protein